MVCTKKFWEFIDNKKSEYDDSVVCFLDILGFKEYIRKTKDGSPKLIEAIRDLLVTLDPEILCPEKQIGEDEFQNFAKEYGAQIVQFSDCIFISMKEISYESLGLYILVLNATSNMLAGGMICRGAVTLGKIYHDDGLIFGPAVVDVYEMESGCAIFPRVIVSKALEIKQKSLRPLSKKYPKQDTRSLAVKYLVRDSDDFLYVDYIKKIYDFERSPLSAKLHLETLRQLIVNSLKETNSLSIEQKWNWVKRKYNNHVSKIITFIENATDDESTRVKKIRNELSELTII